MHPLERERLRTPDDIENYLRHAIPGKLADMLTPYLVYRHFVRSTVTGKEYEYTTMTDPQTVEVFQFRIQTFADQDAEIEKLRHENTLLKAQLLDIRQTHQAYLEKLGNIQVFDTKTDK